MSAINEIKSQITALDPKPKDLRNLGILFCVAGFAAAALLWLKGSQAWVYAAGAGAGFAALGLLLPRVLRPVYLVWMSLAAILGYFVSRLLLALVFFLVITPIGLTMKALGKDVLDKKMRDRDSYWHLREEGSNEPSRAEKMY